MLKIGFSTLSALLLYGNKISETIQGWRELGSASNWEELWRLWEVPQDPIHHPEGNCGNHILETIERASQIRHEVLEKDRLSYMVACLLHDIGKFSHTFYKTEDKKLIYWQEPRPENSRIVAYGHDKAGSQLVRNFLSKLTENETLIEKVSILVRYHMLPLLLCNAKVKAFKKLREKVDLNLVGYIGWADKGEFPFHYFEMVRQVENRGPGKDIVHNQDCPRLQAWDHGDFQAPCFCNWSK